MFEERRIENYKKQIKTLTEENKALKEEVKMLNQRVENMKKITEEADKYIDIMQQERAVLAKAKDKYDIGYKQLLEVKQQYVTKVDELINEVKNSKK